LNHKPRRKQKLNRTSGGTLFSEITFEAKAEYGKLK
jgi:hypothetical protein